MTAGDITLYDDDRFVLESTTREADKVSGEVEGVIDHLTSVYDRHESRRTLDFGRGTLAGTVAGRTLEIQRYEEVWSCRRWSFPDRGTGTPMNALLRGNPRPVKILRRTPILWRIARSPCLHPDAAMRLPLSSPHNRITAAFLLAIALLCVVTVRAYRSTSNLVSTTRLEIESHESIEQLHHLISLLKEAEAGKRDFLLTGESSYLAALDTIRHQVAAQLDRVDRLFEDESELTRLRHELRVRTGERLAEIEKVVQTRQTEGPAAALQLVQSGRGRVLMDRVREVAGQIDIVEGEELREHAQGLEARAQRTLQTIRWGGAFSLLLLACVTLRIRRHLTARVRAERALAESERRYYTLSSATAEGILIHENGVIVDANGALARMSGMPRETLLGRSVLDLFAPESHEVLERHMAARSEDAYEVTSIRADGSRLAIEVQGRSIHQDQRSLRVVALRDITARKQAEAARRESEERFRSLAEHSSDVITTLDGKGTITFGSHSLQHILGYAPEELIGTNAFDLVHPDDSPALQESFQRRLDDSLLAQTTSYRFRHRDGSWRILESRAANRLDDVAVRGIVVNSRDVTERWSAEQKLRRTTEELEAIFRASPLAVISLDERGCVSRWNPAAELTFGWSAEEVIGGPLPYVPEEQQATHTQLRERVFADEAVTGMEVLRRRKDGSPIYLSISIAPLHDDQGRVRGVLSLNEDITDRKLAEGILEEYRQELERSNRELEQFAYVASHDLQEPLRMVSSYVQLLERRYASALDQDAKEFIGFAVDGVRRMQQLIRDLLAFSRLGSRPPTLESVDLEALLEDVLRDLSLVQQEYRAEIVHEELPVVWADAGQMRQLLQNLVGNALKFRRPDIPPRVRLSAAEEEERWRITVADNGIGIAPEYHERIFQIFQRLHTRDEYEGNGIGLAICRKIVELHGGSLSLLSRTGEGSTFSFTLQRPDHDFHHG